MRLYALHCGGDLMDWAAFDPFDERVGTKVYNPYFMYLITHPRGNVLFDTGVHPQMGTDPEARLGPAAASFDARVSPEDHIEARLGTIGLKQPYRAFELVDPCSKLLAVGAQQEGRRVGATLVGAEDQLEGPELRLHLVLVILPVAGHPVLAEDVGRLHRDLPVLIKLLI